MDHSALGIDTKKSFKSIATIVRGKFKTKVMGSYITSTFSLPKLRPVYKALLLYGLIVMLPWCNLKCIKKKSEWSSKLGDGVLQ